MPDEEKIDLKVETNFSDIMQQLSTLADSFNNMKQIFVEAPETTKALSGGLERAIDAVELLQKKTETAKRSQGDVAAQLANEITSGLKDLQTMQHLFSADGSFSTALAKSMFSGFSGAVQRELSASTAQISSMIKTVMGSLTSQTTSGMAREIMGSTMANEIFSKNLKSATSKQYEQYIQMLLPHVMPTFKTGEYTNERYRGEAPRRSSVHPTSFLPESYQSSYNNGGYYRKQLSDTEKELFLQTQQYNQLRNVIMKNDAAARAAYATEGMMKSSNSGRGMLNRNITQGMYEEFRRNLFEDFVNRASGKASSRLDFYDQNLSEKDARRLVGRMTGSSAGRALSAMRDLEGIYVPEAWGVSSAKGYERLKSEARRSLERYEIGKYTFGGLASGKDDRKFVTLSESANTRLLGLSGKHNQFTDKVVVIDMGGYDRKNQQHKELLESIVGGKEVSLPGSDRKYIAQNIHGTGEHTTIRMIEAEAYRAIQKEYADWAKEVGLSGDNYWNNFVDNIDFKNIKDLRKHYDATGKGWSPGSQLRSNLSNKNFGLVDLSRMDGETKKKMADGLAWFARGILPEDALQGRFGVAGKGTAHEVAFDTIGQWAENIGLIQKGERFILPGPRGDVDVTDLHGIFDSSQIKNLRAYDHITSPEELNRAYTSMLRKFGISSITSFDDAEGRASGIGSQAMTFMQLPPQMIEKQVAEYRKRMRLLDTPEGILQYVFGNAEDPIGSMLREGQLAFNDPVVTQRVEAEKLSLANRMASGEWIDFSDSPQVVNQKINRNLAASIVETLSPDRDTAVAQLKDLVQKRTGKEYTDEQIAGIFGLDPNTVLDFTHPEEKKVAVTRSPSGFGQFVAATNYADIAKEVFEAFGMNTSGVFLSKYDMDNVLGDADWDGDAAKTIYGDLAKAFEETVAKQKEARDKILATKKIRQAAEKELQYDGVSDYQDSATHRRLAIESSMDAALSMGATSSAGERAMMFDIYRPGNEDLLIAALQSPEAYSLATAQAKKGTATETTPEMLKALSLRQLYSKLPKNYAKLFNVSGQDGLDVPDEQNIFTASNGVKINLDQLRDLKIDEINLPSRNQDDVVMGLIAGQTVAQQGVDLTRMNAVYEALNSMTDFSQFGERTRELMQNIRMMKLQTTTGIRGATTQEEEETLRKMLADANREIAGRADALGLTGKERSQYINEQNKITGIDTLRNHLDKFGITEKFIAAKYAGNPSMFDSLLFTDRQAALPNTSTDIQLQAEIERDNEKIKLLEKARDELRQKAQQTQTSQKADKAGSGEIDEFKETIEEAKQRQDEIDQLTQQIAETTQTRNKKQFEWAQAMDLYRDQAAYENAVAYARQYRSQLLTSVASKDAKIHDVPRAEVLWGKLSGRARFQQNELDDIAQRENLSDADLKNIERLKQSVLEQTNKEFIDTGILTAKNTFESLEETANKLNPGYDKYIAQIQQYENRLREAKEFQNSLFSHGFQDAGEAAGIYIKQATEQFDTVKKYILNQRENAITKDIENIAQYRNPQFRGFSRSLIAADLRQNYRQAEALKQWNEQRQEQVDALQQVKPEDAHYEEAQAKIKAYTAAIEENKAAIAGLEGVQGALTSVLDSVAQSVARLAQQFGRRLFQRAVQETKQFVTQFTNQMEEIQGVTLKTDEEMSQVRSDTIAQAIGLRTSVSNVSTVKASLYRQGLSDSEVESRTEDVIKFARVSGTKVDAATKIITTALQNNLVSSAAEAMDALVALGDSAATTADEIAKGMQKAAAAADVAGVSYSELVSMLTIITSKTQLGGQQAGSFLNTLFSRMNRVTKSGYANDEDGMTTSINDVETALKNVGISLRSSKTEFRDTFDVLVDLAEIWNDLNDLQRNNVTYAMAGGRQQNMFMTLMEGLAEDGGKQLKEYLSLAKDSGGITDEKYSVMIDNVNSSLETLKSTFDGLIDSLRGDTVVADFFDGITNVVQGITNFTQTASPVAQAAAVITAALAAITAKLLITNIAINGLTSNWGAMVGTLAAIGVAAGVAVAALSSSGSKTVQEEQVKTQNRQKEDLTAFNEAQAKKIKQLQEVSDELDKLKTKYSDVDASIGTFDTSVITKQNNEFKKSIEDITAVIPGLKAQLESVPSAFESWQLASQAVRDELAQLQADSMEMANRVAGELAVSKAEEGNKKLSEIRDQMDDYDQLISEGGYIVDWDDEHFPWAQEYVSAIMNGDFDKRIAKAGLNQFADRTMLQQIKDAVDESEREQLIENGFDDLISTYVQQQYPDQINELSKELFKIADSSNAGESLPSGYEGVLDLLTDTYNTVGVETQEQALNYLRTILANSERNPEAFSLIATRMTTQSNIDDWYTDAYEDYENLVAAYLENGKAIFDDNFRLFDETFNFEDVEKYISSDEIKNLIDDVEQSGTDFFAVLGQVNEQAQQIVNERMAASASWEDKIRSTLNSYGKVVDQEDVYGDPQWLTKLLEETSVGISYRNRLGLGVSTEDVYKHYQSLNPESRETMVRDLAQIVEDYRGNAPTNMRSLEVAREKAIDTYFDEMFEPFANNMEAYGFDSRAIEGFKSILRSNQSNFMVNGQFDAWSLEKAYNNKIRQYAEKDGEGRTLRYNTEAFSRDYIPTSEYAIVVTDQNGNVVLTTDNEEDLVNFANGAVPVDESSARSAASGPVNANLDMFDVPDLLRQQGFTVTNGKGRTLYPTVGESLEDITFTSKATNYRSTYLELLKQYRQGNLTGSTAENIPNFSPAMQNNQSLAEAIGRGDADVGDLLFEAVYGSSPSEYLANIQRSAANLAENQRLLAQIESEDEAVRRAASDEIKNKTGFIDEANAIAALRLQTGEQERSILSSLQQLTRDSYSDFFAEEERNIIDSLGEIEEDRFLANKDLLESENYLDRNTGVRYSDEQIARNALALLRGEIKSEDLNSPMSKAIAERYSDLVAYLNGEEDAALYQNLYDTIVGNIFSSGANRGQYANNLVSWITGLSGEGSVRANALDDFRKEYTQFTQFAAASRLSPEDINQDAIDAMLGYLGIDQSDARLYTEGRFDTNKLQTLSGERVNLLAPMWANTMTALQEAVDEASWDDLQEITNGNLFTGDWLNNQSFDFGSFLNAIRPLSRYDMAVAAQTALSAGNEREARSLLGGLRYDQLMKGSAGSALADFFTSQTDENKIAAQAAIMQLRENLGIFGIRSGTTSNFQNLMSGDTEKMYDVVSNYATNMQQYNAANAAYQALRRGDLRDNNWNTLQNYLGLTDDQLQHYKQNVDELGTLQNQMNAKETGITRSLKEIVEAVFDGFDMTSDAALISDLTSRGEEWRTQILSALLSAFGLDGSSISFSNGEATISGETPSPDTFANVISAVQEASGYSTSTNNRQHLNQIANVLDQYTSVEELINGILGNSEKFGWAQSKGAISDLMTAYNLSEALSSTAQGNMSYADFSTRLTEASSYGALNREDNYGRWMPVARKYFGENFVSGDYNIDQAGLREYLATDEGEQFEEYISSLSGGSEVLETYSENTERARLAQKDFSKTLLAEGVRANKTYGESSEAVADYIEQLNGDTKKASAAIKNMNSTMATINKNTWARNNYRAGKRDSETLNQIASITGMSTEFLKNSQNSSLIEQALKQSESDDKRSIEEYANAQAASIAETLSTKIGEIPWKGTTMDIALQSGKISVDLSDVEGELGSYLTDAQRQFIAILQAFGLQGKLNVKKTGDAIKAWIDVSSLGSGSKGGGGGGGGGGKSAAAKLLEDLKRQKAVQDHQIKMIQYQETKYENAGEIGNQNRMIELENVAQQKLIKTLEESIDKTKAQLAQTKKGSDDWYSLYEAILSYEEAIEEANQAIADNTKKIRENEQAILKLHTDLEDTVETEIKNRIQRQRDMLDGTVSMEDVILEAIRQRYRDEWELVRKDIEKKKEALEEEKNLIDERLQRRKDAEDEAEKYEELAEYKKQLALIQMDSTRTKDAAKLREQIANLEKEIAWDVAEDEAEAQKDAIDDQIKAYDQYLTNGEEDLESLLEDANNFVEEVNSVMQLSQSEMMDWLKANVQEYALSLDDAQEQILQSWTDTYKQMLGITDTYWDEINAILSGKNTFIQYMKESQDYMNASTDEQKQMIYQWGEMYDNWIVAQKRDAVYSHDDDDLYGLGKSETKKSGSNNKTITDANDKISMTDIAKAAINRVITGNTSWNPEITDMTASLNRVASQFTAQGPINQNIDIYAANDDDLAALAAKLKGNAKKAYASGGLVDYTGPAWVDGTKAKPEAFLDAEDTALIRAMLDASQRISVRPYISNIDSTKFMGGGQTIGDVSVTITEAEFKDDADYEEVAKRVGQEFVKELSKQGLMTATYSF